MKRSNIFFVCTLLLALAGMAAQAQDSQRLVVPLSKPGQPVKLHAEVLYGSITVRAQQTQEVVVTARARTSRVKEERTKDGMIRIPNTAMGLTVEENDNTVMVGTDWINRSMDLEITVPVRTSVYLSSTNNGDLLVEGVQGELELENTNGSIEATGIRGSVVAQTTNGRVRVGFIEITPDTPMSFVTFNGNVDVTFPAGLKADLSVNPGRGDIYTDFDVQVEPREPVVDRSEGSGRYRVSVKSEVHAKIGGGGPQMRFKTYNGDVYIRRVGS